MNYYGPLQVAGHGPYAGRFHYTKHNRRTGTVPVGYCADDCPGHETEEEACEHYRQWLLDNATYHHSLAPPQSCEICGAWTDRLAKLPHMVALVPLCEAHHDRDFLDQAVGKIGRSMASV